MTRSRSTPWAATRRPARSSTGALRRRRPSSASRCLLVGDEAAIRAEPARRRAPTGVEILGVPAEVIAMDDEPGVAVRTKKDSSVVRAAEAVRDGAGRRDGRRRQHRRHDGARRCCASAGSGASPGPRSRCRSRCRSRRPQLLVDGGATVDCAPEWLVQFARMGREYARLRLGVDEPTVGLLSNGEEPGKGDELRKQTFAPARRRAVVRRQRRGPRPHARHADVIVTDGFTGNVALKTIEGALKAAAGLVFTVARLDAGGEGGGRGRRAAAAPGRHRLPRPRHHRRRGAPRRRRRVRDLARLVDRPGRSSTRSASPSTASRAGSSTACRQRDRGTKDGRSTDAG